MDGAQIKGSTPVDTATAARDNPGQAEIRRVFHNAEVVDARVSERSFGEVHGSDGNDGIVDDRTPGDKDGGGSDPVIPLGHSNGTYYFIAPSQELRTMKAEALEAGRGVRALFSGFGRAVDQWCRTEFPDKDGDWSHKLAGHWIIKKCNARGVFVPEAADVRSIGVWRDGAGGAIAHCGDCIAFPDGRISPLESHQSKSIMIGDTPITPPDTTPVQLDTFGNLLQRIRAFWGWKSDLDPEIWLGFVAAASLGGYPAWRTHLYVIGSRGSGKSTLMELAGCLLGELSGDAFNDATEAGLRQSRNNQARPLLIDEFEPDGSHRNASNQEAIFALFRRMSGGSGGRISRGGADHKSVSFRALGAAYVTSINHIHMEPQDRSRFVVLELDPLPNNKTPVPAGAELATLLQRCRDLSAPLRGRMLAQSVRWDETHAALSNKALELGADARQAATAATIVAGLDLALFDHEVDNLRLSDHEPLMQSLIGDASESSEACEGLDALEHLLSASLTLDHGYKRTVRELLAGLIDDVPMPGVEDPKTVLVRHGIFVLQDRQCLALRSGRSPATEKLYSETKWRAGAHISALLKLQGVKRARSAIRVAPNQQHRVLLIPFDRLQCSPDH